MFANVQIGHKQSGQTYTFGLRSTSHMVVDLYGLQRLVYDRIYHTTQNVAYLDLYCREGYIDADDLNERLGRIDFHLITHDKIEMGVADPPRYVHEVDSPSSEDRVCTNPNCIGFCDSESHSNSCFNCLSGNCINCKEYRRFFGKSEHLYQAHRRLQIDNNPPSH